MQLVQRAFWRSLFMWGALGIACSTTGLADDASDVLSPADRRHPQADEMRQIALRLRWRQGELDSLAGQLELREEFGRSDLPALRADYDRLIQQCQQCLEAYRSNDLTAARALAKATEQARPDIDWQRLLEARGRQSETWPQEGWVMQMERHRGGRRSREYGAVWTATRRHASAAWAAVADAVLARAVDESLVQLEDTAHRLEAEAKATDAVWNLWEAYDERAAYGNESWSPVFAQATNTIARLTEAMFALCRERAEIERRNREWSRQSRQLAKQLDQAARDARTAREAARRN